MFVSGADSKLCVSYLVGGRDLGWAKEFMEDCASRIARGPRKCLSRIEKMTTARALGESTENRHEA
jgi:hypothetical protein